MNRSIENELKRIRVLLTLIAVLLALQFVPSQPIKDIVGLGLFALAGVYAILLLMESVLQGKIRQGNSEDGNVQGRGEEV